MSEAKSYFNSIKVRLKLQKYNITSALILYFNSIKVRLKLIDGTNLNITRPRFQFHKGTIKTDIDKNEYYIEDISIP